MALPSNSKPFEAQLRDLDRKLRRFSTKEAKNIRKSGALAGAQVVRKKAAANLSGVTADPKSKLAVQRSRSLSTAQKEVFKIGPVADEWHLVFFEYGAAPHDISAKRASVLASEGQVFGKEVSNAGGVVANHFLTRALEDSRQEALEAVKQKILERIRKLK